MLFGDDDDVGLGFGCDIVEGEGEVVFEDDFGGDFAAQDFTEDGGILGKGVARFHTPSIAAWC